jgi:hypothetical protein
MKVQDDAWLTKGYEERLKEIPVVGARELSHPCGLCEKHKKKVQH